MTNDRAGTPGARRQVGMSLIELLVAVSVASVLLAGVGAVFVATVRGVRTTTVKTSTGADVRIAIEAMTRTLKVAEVPYGEDTALVSASTNAVTFYALLNRSGATSTTEPIPTKVQYSWNSATNCLTEVQTPGTTITNPDDGGPYYSWTGAGRSRCMLRTTTAPRFTYYTSGLLSATALSADAGLSTATLSTVRSIGLLVTATDPANPTITGVPAENRVTLENLLTTEGS